MRHFAQRLERFSNRSECLGNTKREITPMRQIRHTENGTFSDRSESLGYTKHGTFSDRPVTELTERQNTRQITQALTRFQIDHGPWVTQNDQVCVTSHRE